jgi:eukaryotic-like serine/threonine-protein kinase
VDALRQQGREPPEILDESLAREVGRAVGVRALLLATVHRFDDRYAIELRALDPVRNEYLFTLKEEGKGKSSVPDLIDRLARRTRERLREETGELEGSRRAVAELTTSNLAAYEHFFRARQAIDLRRFEQARTELEAALRIDSAFTLAHYGVVVIDAWTHKLGRPGLDDPTERREKEHLERALRDVERLPEKERLSLLAWKASVDGKPLDAQRLRDEAAQRFPEDKDAVFWAGDVRFHSQDVEAAIPLFERALALDPGYFLAMEHLVRALGASGRSADQLAWARRWAEAAKDPESALALAQALHANGRVEDAARVYREALPDGPWPPGDYAAQLARGGRVQEAEALLRRGIAARAPIAEGAPHAKLFEELRSSQDEALLAILMAQGRFREADRLAEALAQGKPAFEVSRRRLAFAIGARSLERARAAVREGEAAGLDRDPAWHSQTAIALLLAGDVEGGGARLREARGRPGWQAMPAIQRTFDEAIFAWRTGRLDDADRALRPIAAGVAPEPRYHALYTLGEVAAARGQPQQVVDVLETATAMTQSPGLSWALLHPRMLLLLAAAYDELGDRASARARLGTFLGLWKRADPDLPLLAQARALERRLGAARSASLPAPPSAPVPPSLPAPAVVPAPASGAR